MTTIIIVGMTALVAAMVNGYWWANWQGETTWGHAVEEKSKSIKGLKYSIVSNPKLKTVYPRNLFFPKSPTKSRNNFD
jgi:hypothetical protein